MQVTRPVCHTAWVHELVTEPLMVRWCLEEEVEKEKEEDKELFDNEYDQEEQINNIENNGPLLDARLLWDNL